MSIDPFKVGQQQAEVQMDAIEKDGGDSPKVVMINGAPTDSNAKPYKDGARQMLEERGAEVVKSFDTPDWSPDKAQQEMEGSITDSRQRRLRRRVRGQRRHGRRRDRRAQGQPTSIRARGTSRARTPSWPGIQRILIGEQLMTVYQPIIQIAETAAELAVPIAQGKEPPADVAADKVDNGAKQVPSALLDTIAIQKDNIESTVVKDGFLKVPDICSGAYAKACKEAGLQ